MTRQKNEHSHFLSWNTNCTLLSPTQMMISSISPPPPLCLQTLLDNAHQRGLRSGCAPCTCVCPALHHRRCCGRSRPSKLLGVSAESPRDAGPAHSPTQRLRRRTLTTAPQRWDLQTPPKLLRLSVSVSLPAEMARHQQLLHKYMSNILQTREGGKKRLPVFFGLR